jgi:uncharacterized protein DUF4038/uncharacterized protein DUF5060/collagenase-like protein with putative collagen-binding domain
MHHLAFTICCGIFAAALGLPSGRTPAAASIHVWEKQELTFHSARTFANPYTDATVWVDLKGPGIDKRVYGFWDGGDTFRVRLVATAPGEWRWTSGSQPNDSGLSDKSGSFTAIDWPEQDKQQNPLRRGFIRATRNNHALEFADGTPFFAVGDTWYSVGTNRFKWYDDDAPRPIGPEAGFKDYVRLRKAQGYNWISIIAAFPNWDNDGRPWHIVDEANHLTVRSAWLEFGTGPDARSGTAKNMKNEGGRPFLFPGKAKGFEDVFPDMDRINPEYFKYLDRKIDYLNANGFVAFIESFRRDASELWMKYHAWPESPARYMEYIRARYGANNIVFSPVHLDIIAESITVPQFNAAIQKMADTYGPPPFGTLMSANANPSTLTNWGPDSWVTLHTTGNKREHEYYWYLTEIFREPHTHPALNGEPYYSGYVDARGLNGGYKYGAPGGSEKDAQFVRSAMYGNVLSGGLAGHVYGAEGIWGADIEPAAPTHMWNAFQWSSGADMTYLPKFVLSDGRHHQDLVPDDYVVPSRTPVTKGYEGWAYAARTPDRGFLLAYFEKGCPQSRIRGVMPETTYRARWFNPRKGEWMDVGNGEIKANNIGEIALPAFPDAEDWGLSLTRAAR